MFSGSNLFINKGMCCSLSYRRAINQYIHLHTSTHTFITEDIKCSFILGHGKKFE